MVDLEDFKTSNQNPHNPLTSLGQFEKKKGGKIHVSRYIAKAPSQGSGQNVSKLG